MASQRCLFDFLSEPLLTLSTRGGSESVTIPGLLERWGRGNDGELAFVQAHQQHAVHAFFVQLAAVALARAGITRVDLDAAQWTELLLALTNGAREPYCLVVSDLSKPALLQPPVPEGSLEGWNTASAADEIDILVTARNHDVKRARMFHATPEHWFLSLVSLQTMQGYSGQQNYGVVRMNGGHGNRPCLAFAPVDRAAARFRRDVRVLLDARDRIIADFGYKREGLALLWLEPWDGEKSLHLSDCDPFFIEICRRVRLECDENGRIIARKRSTTVPRIDGKKRNGNVGDPWIPVKRHEGKALTVDEKGFHYKRLSDLLFGGNYTQPFALQLRDEDGEHPIAIARALARGQGKTAGFHERVVPIPRHCRSFFQQREKLDRLRDLAKERIEISGKFQEKVLYPALSALLTGGFESGRSKPGDHRVERFCAQADREIDACFFEDLFQDVEHYERDPSKASSRWETRLYEIGKEVLEKAIASAPIPVALRPRAIAIAYKIYCRGARSVLPNAGDECMNDTEPKDKNSWRQAALQLAKAIEHASPGDRADLRRGGSRAVPAFYKVCAAFLGDVLRPGPNQDEEERRWMLLAQLFAILGPNLVEEGRSLGEALFAAGVAEHRVLRLLRAEGDDLVPLLRHTIHQLSSTGESTCPIELTKLVLATGSRAESIRRKIARHYYAVAEGVAR